MTTKYCKVHPLEALANSHPPDVENGPEPSDVENQLICYQCLIDEEIKWNNSPCPHRPGEVKGHCLDCVYADAEPFR